MPPKLYRVVMQVGNIERAAVFYEGVLGVRGERAGPGRHRLNLSGVVLECVDPAAEGLGYGATPNPDLLHVAVDDLEGAYARASGAGCQWLDPITTHATGERSFTLRDPFGNPVSIAAAGSVASPVRRG